MSYKLKALEDMATLDVANIFSDISDGEDGDNTSRKKDDVSSSNNVPLGDGSHDIPEGYANEGKVTDDGSHGNLSEGTSTS